MRMDTTNTLTADEIVNRWSEKKSRPALPGSDEHDAEVAKAIVTSATSLDPKGYRALGNDLAGSRKQWEGETASPQPKRFWRWRIAGDREMRNRAVSFSDPPHNDAALPLGGNELPLAGKTALVKHAFQEESEQERLRCDNTLFHSSPVRKRLMAIRTTLFAKREAAVCERV